MPAEQERGRLTKDLHETDDPEASTDPWERTRILFQRANGGAGARLGGPEHHSRVIAQLARRKKEPSRQ